MTPEPQWQSTADHTPDSTWQSTSDQSPETKASVGGFLSNVLSSAGKFAGDLAGPLLHPQNFATGTAGLLQGMAEKSGFPAAGGQSHQQYVDALIQHYSDRYGGFDNFRKTLYEDPIGVLSDVAAITGAGGAVAKGTELAADAAKLGTVADVAGKVGDVAKTVEGVTNPLKLAGKAADATGATEAVGKFADWAATKLNKSALRGGYNAGTADASAIDQAAATMAQKKIPLSDEGIQQISQSLADLQQAKNGATDRAANAGVTISRDAVLMPVRELRTKYAAQVNPQGDLKQIDSVIKNFEATNGPSIPVDRAEALKEGTYANNKYGGSPPPQVAATAAAEKVAAHSLMTELEKAVPELADLNPQQKEFLNLKPVLEKAVNKYALNGGFLNSIKKGAGSKVGLSLTGVGGAAAIAAHNPDLAAAGMVAQFAQAILSDPVVKSRLAIAINKAQQLNPQKWGAPSLANAAARISDFTKSLETQQ